MKNKYNITYNDLVGFINESIVNIINEGRNADKAKQKTLEVIRGFFNNASWLDNEFVDAAANPNHLSVIDYIENKLREWLFHANIPDAVIRLEPIIMNIALSLGFEQQNQDSAKLNRLGLIVNYIISNFRKEGFPIQLNQLQLNDTTYDTLNNIFGKYVDAAMQQDNAVSNSYGKDAVMNPKYEVIEIPDYETAKKYGDYSCSGSKLCYTQSINTWEQYTNNGINRVYLILNKNWRNIPEEHGKNTPYDEYGLSMIFVFIDGEGNIAYSNTRWNHSNRGNGPSNVDQSFNKSDISKLLGVNFDSIFKPYSKEELRKKGYISFEEVPELLKQGISPKEIFSTIGLFKGGCALVELNNKYNFMDENSRLLSPNQWFEYATSFNNGYAVIGINDKYNFINREGDLLFPNQWLADASGFNDGYAIVEINEKYNYVDTEGNIVSPNQWFDDVYNFNEEFGRVKINNKWNYINTKGEILIPNKWFDEAADFCESYAAINLNNKWNYIDKEGNIVSPNQWFDYAGNFSEGYARVEVDNKYNYINVEGKILSPKLWFDSVGYFDKGYAIVKLNNKCNFMNTEGDLLSPNQWFDLVWKFTDDYAVVKLNKKYNYIDTKGNLLSPNQWFDGAQYFDDDYGEVLLNNKWYNIDTDGILFYEDEDDDEDEDSVSLNENKIHLTESQLHNIIFNIIKDYL